jgi:tubulin polyglutamylase TTLL7
MSPNTYLLTEPQRSTDLARLEKEHYPGRLYIMKKNVQRQTGLEITDDINKIKNNSQHYVLVQELLQDPYLINGRKINLRIYIVVVCHEDNTDVYMFNDGFMYYTKKDFVKGSQDNDTNITTGYVERDVYTKNPLTHTDFKKYLDMNEGERYHPTNPPRKLCVYEDSIRKQNLRISNVVFNRIENLMRDVFVSFKGSICRKNDDANKTIPIYTDYSIQIFGGDISINDQLQPQIMEINKGPDLGAKDERDGNVKKKLVNDTLEIIGIKPLSKDNGLIRILEM